MVGNIRPNRHSRMQGLPKNFDFAAKLKNIRHFYNTVILSDGIASFRDTQKNIHQKILKKSCSRDFKMW